MCLDHRIPRGVYRSWLANGKSTITLYKVVVKKEKRKGYYRYYPIFANKRKPFYKQKMNVIAEEPPKINITYNLGRPTSYTPHFHLFLDIREARSLKKWRKVHEGDVVILECEVSKKDITCVGYQRMATHTSDKIVVVKAFKIIKEVDNVPRTYTSSV